MKKALILYDSVYGNTKKIAMSLIRGLEAGGLYVDSSSIENYEISEIRDYDIIGIGGPTHFHGLSKNMKSFLLKIKNFRLEDKLGFAFETKANFRLAGSAVKKIMKKLKKLKMKIIHTPITGIVLGKEGPLEENTTNYMEHIGLKISEKVDKDYRYEMKNQEINKYKDLKIFKRANQIKWIFLGGGPLFFFIRAIYLAAQGGDCFGTINPFFSWLLLISEISFSGIAWIIGNILLIQWLKQGKEIIILTRTRLSKIILLTGIIAYIIHFMRVAIWIFLCVM
jgi:menaquinone-dependent protoporphyrinogen IX oxidase